MLNKYLPYLQYCLFGTSIACGIMIVADWYGVEISKQTFTLGISFQIFFSIGYAITASAQLNKIKIKFYQTATVYRTLVLEVFALLDNTIVDDGQKPFSRFAAQAVKRIESMRHDTVQENQ